jgi:hypothetical protein
MQTVFFFFNFFKFLFLFLGSCPIMSQTEVSAAPRKDVRVRWSTDQGVYFPVKVVEKDDDEL